MMVLPKDKNYPLLAVQCDNCGGHGCDVCRDKGWLPKGHLAGRRCERPGCHKWLHPSSVAVYCSSVCAAMDA